MNGRQTEVTVTYYLPDDTDDQDPNEERSYTVITNNAGIGEILSAMDSVLGWGEDDES